MQISLNWLKEYVDIDISPDELADRLTMLGLEIESMERPGAEIRNVVVGQILSIEPHPDADKLVVCRTEVGEEAPIQIVCGAKNMKEGDKVPTAVVGATLPGGFEIARRKMRGIESQGMMCSGRELGISDDHGGLMILPEDMSVGEDAVKALGLDDVIYEIEVTPNRNDWSSMFGVARELAAYYGKTFKKPETHVQETGGKAQDLSSVTIEAPDLCPRYIGRVIKNVQIGPSPDWLVKRLIAAGQRPINNVVDITNFVLMETGHPLHAFDYDKLAQNRIVVRRAAKGEQLITIDGEKRTLTPDMLVIADAKNAVALAGVMGGQDSEVGDDTVNVFLESAYFDPICIRKTARAQNMITEASQRFQRGADPEMAYYAMERATQLMQELAGGEVAVGQLDAYPAPLEKREITLRYARTAQLLGAEVPVEDQKRYLTGLGFDLVHEDDASCTFVVPSWRHDCTQEADLIEEVARHFGYDQIASTMPLVRQSEAVFAPADRKIRALRRYLAGLGLNEALNMTFSSPKAVERAGLTGEYLEMVALQNPMSENQATMRSSLIPALINNVSANVRHGVHNVRLFEIGPVYRPGEEDLPSQSIRLGIALSGAYTKKHWSRPEHEVDFYDLKGLAEAIFNFLAVQPTLKPGSLGAMQAGQCGAILYGDKHLGWLGEIKKSVADQHDLEQKAFVMEIDLDPLLEKDASTPKYAAIPAFPPSLRDLAALVDQSVPAGALLDAAREAGGKYLKEVELFDIYTGKQIPQGKKSVALSLVFQSADRTLTDKATQKAFDSIVKKLRKEFGAELR